jgi:predicted DNA-binding transcriptional regulator YafY
MLQLLSLLQTHRQWRGPDLAERLEISERTLRRDVERLREVGYVIDASPGVDGGYRLGPGAALPPLVLDDEEAVALAVGLQSALQAGTVLGIEESSVRALTKIVQVMPPRLRHQVDAIASMTVPALWGETGEGVNPGTLVELAQACRDSERLQFSYADRDAHRSERRVEPHRLVLLGRRWYLIAWDLDRQDWRSFRLDRLSEPRSAGAQFLPRELPSQDAATFLRMGIESVARQLQVEAIVDASTEQVRSRLGTWAAVEDLYDGRCRVRIASDAPEWPTVALCTLGVPFEIVGPPEVVEFARLCAARLGSATAPISAPIVVTTPRGAPR